jgi:CheY-like chemotaxis protein
VNHTKRILIVDDDEGNRSLLEALLASSGYQCCLASDGWEALGCLAPNIDLVLLDIVMPGLDGYEVARQIRAGRACPDVPIVMVSGLDSTEDRLKAEQAGANFFVTKPVDQAQLRSRISALLDDAGTAGVA